MTDLYLIRHCSTTGQAPDAPLTDEGLEQAERLAGFLENAGIASIVCSPFLRARQSIEPLARRLGMEVQIDERLAERTLSAHRTDDWEERLRASFDDLDLCYEGGESSRAAMIRGVAAVEDALASASGPVAIVSHGNLMTLLLRHFDNRSGFEAWRALTNPDVFKVSDKSGSVLVERIDLASSRGAAGTLERPLSWKEIREIAREDRLTAKHRRR